MGRVRAAELLLQAEADLNSLDATGSTPLLLACTVFAFGAKPSDEQVAVVELLLSARAKPDLADTDGVTPLLAAARRNTQVLPDLLLRLGACPDGTDGARCPERPLKSALMRKNVWLVKVLVEKRANLEKVDRNQSAALAWVESYVTSSKTVMIRERSARAHTFKGMLNHLCMFGTEHLNAATKGFHSPLHTAWEQLRKQPLDQKLAIQILLEAGADPNIRRSEGRETLLHMLCKEMPNSSSGHLKETIRILLSNRADALSELDNGATPLSLALATGSRWRGISQELLQSLPEQSLTASKWSKVLFSEIVDGTPTMLGTVVSRTGVLHRNGAGQCPMEVVMENLLKGCLLTGQEKGPNEALNKAETLIGAGDSLPSVVRVCPRLQEQVLAKELEPLSLQELCNRICELLPTRHHLRRNWIELVLTAVPPEAEDGAGGTVSHLALRQDVKLDVILPLLHRRADMSIRDSEGLSVADRLVDRAWCCLDSLEPTNKERPEVAHPEVTTLSLHALVLALAKAERFMSLEERQAEAAQQNVLVSSILTRVKKQTAEVEAMRQSTKDLLQEKLDRVSLLGTHVDNVLSELTREDLLIARHPSAKERPELMLALAATCVALDVPVQDVPADEPWGEEACSLFLQPALKLFNRPDIIDCLKLEKDSVPPSIVDRLRALQEHPQFDADVQSKTGLALMEWVKYLIAFSDVSREMEPTKASFKELLRESQDLHAMLSEEVQELKAMEGECADIKELIAQEGEEHLALCAAELHTALEHCMPN